MDCMRIWKARWSRSASKRRTLTARVPIVVEYDGFDHHFLKGKEVNVGNHERYMVEADIERQLTLESYGYRFLRVNRFNLVTDPVRTLSDRLIRLVEGLTVDHNGGSIQNMQDEAEGLTTGELKTCSRCKKIKPQDAFFDKTLKRAKEGVAECA